MLKRKRLAGIRLRKRRNKHEEQKQAELLTLVGQNIETIIEYQLRSEKKINSHQRIIEMLTKNVGRPRFFYLTMLLVVLWILLQLVLTHLGLTSFDPPPFAWLQGLISLIALLITTMVLITQNRQDKQAAQQRHLDLQVALLVEQKVTKIISLVEELRRDIPSVENRYDAQAEAMQEVLDPKLVLTALESMLPEEGTIPQLEEGMLPINEHESNSL